MAGEPLSVGCPALTLLAHPGASPSLEPQSPCGSMAGLGALSAKGPLGRAQALLPRGLPILRTERTKDSTQRNASLCLGAPSPAPPLENQEMELRQKIQPHQSGWGHQDWAGFTGGPLWCPFLILQVRDRHNLQLRRPRLSACKLSSFTAQSNLIPKH